MLRRMLAAASLLLFAGVALGAFGAHGLRDRLDEYALGIYEKAVFYHLVHAVGLLSVACIGSQGLVNERALRIVGYLLIAGIVLFSGSLYLLAITGAKWLSAITPLGGLSFLAAWGTLAYGALRR